MKSPKTRLIIVSVIALASIVGIFVFAQSPTPTVSGQDLPVHLVMTCAMVDKPTLMRALRNRPADTYRFEFEHDPAIGTLPAITPPPCPSAHLNGNSTQKATFANTKELRTFLKAAGL